MQTNKKEQVFMNYANARKSLPLTTCLFCICFFANSQAGSDSLFLQRKTADSVLASEKLLALPGLPVTFYNSGYVVRATAIQK